MIGLIVFATMFVLDTGAVLHLLWMGIIGQLGFDARLIACAVVAMVVLSMFVVIGRRPVSPKRSAPKKRTRRPRDAAKSGTVEVKAADQNV